MNYLRVGYLAKSTVNTLGITAMKASVFSHRYTQKNNPHVTSPFFSPPFSSSFLNSVGEEEEEWSLASSEEWLVWTWACPWSLSGLHILCSVSSDNTELLKIAPWKRRKKMHSDSHTWSLNQLFFFLFCPFQIGK